MYQSCTFSPTDFSSSLKKHAIKDQIVNLAKLLQPDSFQELIQNKYMKDYIDIKKEEDRRQYVNTCFLGQPRTFKNFINNNSNILRKSCAIDKMQTLTIFENHQKSLH